MSVLVNVLSVLYVLCCIFIIVLVLLQKSDKELEHRPSWVDKGGASESIMGSSGNNFYEKNKGRTREGKLKNYTILFSTIFVILTIVLTILNMKIA